MLLWMLLRMFLWMLLLLCSLYYYNYEELGVTR